MKFETEKQYTMKYDDCIDSRLINEYLSKLNNKPIVNCYFNERNIIDGHWVYFKVNLTYLKGE